MRFTDKNERRWRLLLPVLAILVVVGLAATALNGSSTSNRSAGGTYVPQRNGVSGAPVSAQAAEQAALAQIQEKRLPNGARVVQEVAHDTSIPLRDMKPAEPIAGAREEGPENPIPLIKRAETPLKDTVVQDFFGPLVMPTPIITFDGIDRTTSSCNCLPPDTNGDVGPNHYVQWNNLAIQMWTKTGVTVFGPVAGNTLFAGFPGTCATQNSGDPIALYDSQADRWFLSQFLSSAPYGMCIAVSTSPDPTGSYNRYQFTLSAADFYDYEKYGVWPDAYYMSANVFEGDGGFHPSAIAYDRTRMLAGQTATYIEFNPGNYYASLLPSDLDGSIAPPAGAPNYFASASGSNTEMYLWEFHADFANPTSSSFTGPAIIPVAPVDPDLCGGSRNCIPQPTVTQRLDSLNNHLMYRLAYRNLGTHEALVTSQSVDENGSDHSGVRWYEVRSPGDNPYVYQQGTYAPDANHRWMSSAAMDRDGNIAVGYSLSSNTVYPSVAYAGRLASDPLGVLAQGEAIMYPGTGSQTSASGRWGDYSMMTVDPVDDCTFWFTNEYYAATSSANWRTRIGSFKFPSCGAPPVTPTGTPPTAVPTNTPAPPTPTACANYTIAQSTGATIVPGTTSIGNNCDDCTTLITPPFPIQLYERTFNSAYVSSNGVISFNSSSSAFGNACLPVPIYSYTVLPYWDDLYTGDTAGGQGVFSSVSGTAPNRIWNLEWRANLCCNPSIAVNFETRFYEGSNRVDVIYGNVLGGGAGQTIGIERDMGAFTQHSCDTPGIVLGTMLSFTAAACPATATSVPPTLTATNTVVPPTLTATNTVVVPTVSPTPGTCSIQFSDVDVSNTFYTSIRCLACRGIVSGYSDGTFRPNNQVTRGQLAKMVSNSAGYSETITGQTFTDVPPSNTFYVWIERLARRGHMSGYNCGGPGEPCVNNMPYFRPFANATRGQTSKIVSNAAGFNETPSGQTFQDVSPSHTFYAFIQRLADRGVMSGYACGRPDEPCVEPENRPYFRPNNDVTRGQSSKIVANAFFPGCDPAVRP